MIGENFTLDAPPQREPCIYLTYAGATVDDSLDDLGGALQNASDIDSFVIQAIWNFSLSACFAGLYYSDLHLENIVLRRIPPCRLRYAISNSNGHTVGIDFPTTFTVGVVDHVLDTKIPYTRMNRRRSSRSSSSSRSADSDPFFFVHIMTMNAVLLLIKKRCHTKRLNNSVTARTDMWIRFFGTIGASSFVWFTSFVRLIMNGPTDSGCVALTLPSFQVIGEPDEIDELLRQLGTDSLSDDLPWNYFDKFHYGSYFFFSRDFNIYGNVFQNKNAPARLSRGRPRLYLSNAEKQKAYRLRYLFRKASVVSDRGTGLDIFSISAYDTTLVYINFSLCCPGLGVFARVRIRKGSYITRYDGCLLSREIADALKPWQKTHLRSRDRLADCLDGMRLPCPLHGVASFINSSRGSSCRSNAIFKRSKDDLTIYAKALRDIEPNEEIMIDYEYASYVEDDAHAYGTKRAHSN